MLKKNGRQRLGKFPDRPDHFNPLRMKLEDGLTERDAKRALRRGFFRAGVRVVIPNDSGMRTIIGIKGTSLQVDGFQMTFSPTAILC